MQGGDYEVFLSFRGRDTREGFTDFLYTHLVDAGVRVFRDDSELCIGETISSNLLLAIEQSKISIPILSKGYASSGWCLMVLTRMLECREKKGQIIMSIFYDVKLSKVRYQTRCYGEAFLSHQNERRHTNETIHKWRAAFHEVGSLQEFNLTTNWSRRQGSIVKKVVANVLSVLKSHVEGVMELLHVESSELRVVGIHGIGGSGKTTIAKLIYKRIYHSFDGFSFLESIRENAEKPGGLVDLQGQLMSDLVGAMHKPISSFNDGSKPIRSGLLHKKVLIVLDDIEPSFGLAKIIESLRCSDPGSRIIIITRDEQAFDELGVMFLKYKVGDIQPAEALELFHVYAFREKLAPDDFPTLSKEIVSIIECLL